MRRALFHCLFFLLSLPAGAYPFLATYIQPWHTLSRVGAADDHPWGAPPGGRYGVFAATDRHTIIDAGSRGNGDGTDDISASRKRGGVHYRAERLAASAVFQDEDLSARLFPRSKELDAFFASARRRSTVVRLGYTIAPVRIGFTARSENAPGIGGGVGLYTRLGEFQYSSFRTVSRAESTIRWPLLELALNLESRSQFHTVSYSYRSALIGVTYARISTEHKEPAFQVRFETRAVQAYGEVPVGPGLLTLSVTRYAVAGELLRGSVQYGSLGNGEATLGWLNLHVAAPHGIDVSVFGDVLRGRVGGANFVSVIPFVPLSVLYPVRFRSLETEVSGYAPGMSLQYNGGASRRGDEGFSWTVRGAARYARIVWDYSYQERRFASPLPVPYYVTSEGLLFDWSGIIGELSLGAGYRIGGFEVGVQAQQLIPVAVRDGTARDAPSGPSVPRDTTWRRPAGGTTLRLEVRYAPAR